VPDPLALKRILTDQAIAENPFYEIGETRACAEVVRVRHSLTALVGRDL
jgi:hypothetical protein